MKHAADLLSYLRARGPAPDADAVADGPLVETFVKRRDEGAFHALLRRHGPMVWGVCLRVLQNRDDAEDAFQATFLVLVRKAGSIAPPALVGNWLHGVAYRAAQKALALRVRRREHEQRASVMRNRAVSDSSESGDWRQALDQELTRLPQKYRMPIVLCDLEGKTRAEAARQLDWPEGTVAGRLARARELLARRLVRHGIAMSGAGLAAALTQPASAAAMPPLLAATTCQVAQGLMAGPISGATAAPQVAAIVQGVLRTMLIGKLKVITAVVLLALMIGLGVGAAVVPMLPYQSPGRPAAPAAVLPVHPSKGVSSMINDSKGLQGTWDFTSLQIDGADMAPAMVQGSTIEVVGNQFTTTSPGVVYKGTFKVDASKQPKTLDLHFTEGPEKGNTSLGIYELDGDHWRICLEMTGKDRPESFATNPGSGCALETLQRRRHGSVAPAIGAAACVALECSASPRATNPAAPDVAAGGVGLELPPAQEETKSAEAVKKELAALEGEWTMASGESNGQPLPKEFVQGGKRVAKNAETTVTFGGQLFMKAKYTIDPAKKPKTMDYAISEGFLKGKMQLGIYHLDGDTVKFCFATPGSERPTDFKTKPGDNWTLTEWKRVKK